MADELDVKKFVREGAKKPAIFKKDIVNFYRICASMNDRDFETNGKGPIEEHLRSTGRYGKKTATLTKDDWEKIKAIHKLTFDSLCDQKY